MNKIKTRLRKVASSIKHFKVLSDIIYVDEYFSQDLGITLEGKNLLNVDPDDAYHILYENDMAYDSGEIIVPAGSFISQGDDSYECEVKLPNGKIAIMDLDLTDISSLLEEVK